MKTKNVRKPTTKKPGKTMARALSTLAVTSAILFIVEAVLLAALILMVSYDVPAGFKDLMKAEHWILISVIIFVVDAILCWVTVLSISRIRRRSDLISASYIGSDIQEAYGFGQLGIVVTDESNTVVWENTFLQSRQIDLIDTDILAWKSELAELEKGAARETKISVNGYEYVVKYIRQASMFLFKDTTDYETVSEYSRQQATCIGMVTIDNYSDVVGNNENDDNDVMTKVRSAIFEYAKKHHALVRRFREDSYFVVCNFTSLHAMEEDGFALLEDVRNLGKGMALAPTLSIGFAHHIDDVTKLYDMASNAIDIATSRGGDQAVVSHYGEELKYYGGRAAAIENTGRVQFRSLADSTLSLIRSSSEVYVSGHTYADMDAIGACLGILALCEHEKVPCRIIYDPKLAEAKARLAFQSSFDRQTFNKITISPKDAADEIRSSTLFIVVDTSVPNNIIGQAALEKSSKTIVIDHHRRGEAFVERPVLTHIDTSAGSATEIICEMIKYSSANPRIVVPSAYATLMLSGIFLDTSFFRSKSTGVRSFEAAEILKEFGADNGRANEFLKDEIEEYNLITKIASTMKSPYTGIMYCVSDEDDIVEKSALAKVANQIRNLKGVNATFVVGRVKQNEVAISARSDGTINVQLLMEKLGGGGHYGMAAASFTNVDIEVVEARLLEVLATYLDEAKSDLGGKE